LTTSRSPKSHKHLFTHLDNATGFVYFPDMTTMYKLVLLRHGQSEWNLQNKFTGWTDVDVTEKGVDEAKNAGILLKKNGFTFDIAFTSVLTRAIKTLHFALEEMDQLWIPEVKAWQLNERHYGALQGLNKAETAQKEGKEQVHLWRRSYTTKPPLLAPDDERHPIRNPRYATLHPEQIPSGENLHDTVLRVQPYWNDTIRPQIEKGKSVLIAAHGNSLRALAKILEKISDADIPNLEIPTGQPLVYELASDFSVVKKYYLE